MAANANGEYKVFKYYEGLCSSSDFPKEIAKVLALGVKTKTVYDVDKNVIEEPFILKSKNWDIVYPQPDSSLGLDLKNLTTEEYKRKIDNQVAKIADTVILKTTTTPKELTDEEIDDLTVDSDSNKASLTMYLEIYKPAYIVNPEEYPLDCERQGITPKLITKGMYEDSFKTQHAAEEYIYTSPICTVDKKDDTTIGSIELDYAKCDAYVSKLNNIFGNTSFSVPSANGATTTLEINSAYLAKIKQNDAELYELFLNTLDGGEGIEPKTYSLLNALTIEVTKEDVVYTMIFEGVKKLTTYSITKKTVYTVKNVPIEVLTPEFYLDGIYIPLSTTLYHTDNQRIIFDDNISFEASTNGVMVVRYNYEVSGNDIIPNRVTILNNHHVLMRLFDRINEDGSGPMDNVYNSSGEIVQTNSHISPWSKLSWFKDFEEIMIDSVDTDASISSIHDGTVFVPLETSGLNADTKMRYWINTNNDRFNIVVMGNPSLDYQKDRHLISACYCGKIDSFENSLNDTAGNFALFTSSSTEPCNTSLTMEKVTYDMPNYSLTEAEIKNDTYNVEELSEFIENCPWSSGCGKNQVYYIQLTDKNYFNREKWPKYVIVDSAGKPVTPLMSAYKRNFIMNNGKADFLQLSVDPTYITYDETYTIFVYFSYYQEKFVINSGVSRDVFGNVINVDKINDYGTNTSDGVTSIMMYHTRSKAYYQRHHMMFATTEEYMSKVMYGKSSYTGEYYADRIKVTHGNDGPRGTLSDLLIIDSSSLYALDELVINKDFEKDPDEYEETFIYFPVSAPFSPLSDSPNSRYGVAIKKKEIEPVYKDEALILKIAMNELEKLAEEAWWPVDKNIIPRDQTSNGCSVYWSIVPDSAWVGTEATKSTYVPVQLAVINTSEYQGNTEIVQESTDGVVLAQGTKKADTTLSYLGVTGFTAGEDEKIAYGISNIFVDSFCEGAQIKAVLSDGTSENEIFEYKINEVPYTAEIGTVLPTGDTTLIDAAPDKYLMLYSVKEEVVLGKTKYIITKFSCVPLKDTENGKNWLLQYPCSMNVYIEGGKGGMLYNNQTVNSITTSIDYDGNFVLPLIAAPGYKISKATIVNADNPADIQTITSFEAITVGEASYQGISIDNVDKNYQIKILFELI